ncbi:MAG: hypothetical protein LBT81_02295 [Helicobacteraceae bacterium]|jgi:hypothetical protein|nr:hypothetical protein [Helicobacteraceae bacterium]
MKLKANFPLLLNCCGGRKIAKGDVFEVKEERAAALIDSGKASLYEYKTSEEESSPDDKPKRKKRWE